MIELARGNLLETDAEALVNTVNCVGAMGKGIALQFKQAFPENFKEYERACRAEEVEIGRMFTVPTGSLVNPRYIINFPTKKHWRERSRLEYISAGLEDLVREIKRYDIRSIAIPPLGCGNGGLDWSEVRPLIESALAEVPDVKVFLFAPQLAPAADDMVVATRKASMTGVRAALIRLMEQYRVPGYRLTLLEVQKLAYFLQLAGMPMRLNYVRHRFGPYAENLNHLLQRMEGHFIRGYGDRSRQTPGIFLLPKANEQARMALAKDAKAQEQIEKVTRLIEGFETPYGMELLGSVHWVISEHPKIASDVDAVISRVHEWNPRKHTLFTPEHIQAAWRRLMEEGWFQATAGGEETSLQMAD